MLQTSPPGFSLREGGRERVKYRLIRCLLTQPSSLRLTPLGSPTLRITGSVGPPPPFLPSQGKRMCHKERFQFKATSGPMKKASCHSVEQPISGWAGSEQEKDHLSVFQGEVRCRGRSLTAPGQLRIAHQPDSCPSLSLKRPKVRNRPAGPTEPLNPQDDPQGSLCCRCPGPAEGLREVPFASDRGAGVFGTVFQLRRNRGPEGGPGTHLRTCPGRVERGWPRGHNGDQGLVTDPGGNRDGGQGARRPPHHPRGGGSRGPGRVAAFGDRCPRRHDASPSSPPGEPGAGRVSRQPRLTRAQAPPHSCASPAHTARASAVAASHWPRGVARGSPVPIAPNRSSGAGQGRGHGRGRRRGQGQGRRRWLPAEAREVPVADALRRGPGARGALGRHKARLAAAGTAARGRAQGSARRALQAEQPGFGSPSPLG